MKRLPKVSSEWVRTAPRFIWFQEPQLFPLHDAAFSCIPELTGWRFRSLVFLPWLSWHGVASSRYMDVLNRHSIPIPTSFSVPSSNAQVRNLEPYFLVSPAAEHLTMKWVPLMTGTCMRLEVRIKAEGTFPWLWLCPLANWLWRHWDFLKLCLSVQSLI